MAATKSHAKPAMLGTVLKAVEIGFAAVVEDIADIKSTMATKQDIAAVKKEMATKRDILGIMDELADIKQRLKAVGAAVEDHAGHSKEIDHALERIAAIEKHVGLHKKIAA